MRFGNFGSHLHPRCPIFLGARRTTNSVRVCRTFAGTYIIDILLKSNSQYLNCTTTTSPMPNPLRRRNGQLSSCEPCRRSKLRCDHGRPRCARCERRGISSQQCYYHPAPMSQHRQMSWNPEQAAPSTPDTTPKTIDYEVGPVGMHSALLSVTTGDSAPQVRTQPFLTLTGVATPSHAFEPTPTLLVEGAEVLKLLLDLLPKTNDSLQLALAEIHEHSINRPVGITIIAAMYRAMRNLSMDPSTERRHEMSKAIFETTFQPFVFPESPADGAFEDAFCNPTARWESVGIFFASMGLILASEKRLDIGSSEYPAKKLERNAMAVKAFHASMQCHTFCERMGRVNDLTLWLLITAGCLATWCFGDDSYCVWQVMGTMASVYYAMDLHRGTKNAQSLPEYAVEIRRRAISITHELDKDLATFVSRPARITRQYCSLELPLDLPDSVLLGRPEEFQAAKARLDERGWNQDGIILRTFRERAKLSISFFREEVLELSLGRATSNLEQQAK